MEEQTNAEIGKKIRALRKIRGISLQQMAAETGMSYSYLSGLENGKHSVSITNLQRVAAFFKVDMIYFLQPAGQIPRVIRMKDLYQDSSTFGDISYRVVTPADSNFLQASYVYMPPRISGRAAYSQARSGSGDDPHAVRLRLCVCAGGSISAGAG